jgi:hypothetical protein
MSSKCSEEDRHSGDDSEQPQKRIRLSPKDTASEKPHPVIEKGGEGEEDDNSPKNEDDSAPPLPDEEVPPLPNEPVPVQPQDDGWDPVWDDNAQAYYFYNRFTGLSQWENPRVPDASQSTSAAGIGNHDRIANNDHTDKPSSRPVGGYDPAIHGDYDPTAPYAQEYQEAQSEATAPQNQDPNMIYTATGAFNRFTGKWQQAGLTPENFNDENKSRRQMNAFFDVDAAANTHDGKSLKAERSGKKLSKKEVKAFKDKRREKKEEKRRAWLRD